MAGPGCGEQVVLASSLVRPDFHPTSQLKQQASKPTRAFSSNAFSIYKHIKQHRIHVSALLPPQLRLWNALNLSSIMLQVRGVSGNQVHRLPDGRATAQDI
ncbi:hypothetical protein N657DRAFT_647385 [Parathielavia appendiculata]|uniref:Uncharacterized protein n=1 Tax=Parathielavia appendiculata TaxID=2587402 RepID=A0AAN6Z1Y6_9PEZI|nr:hypothetical protein N657DRAFT_647385 [Parathielavia appendiculata]